MTKMKSKIKLVLTTILLLLCASLFAGCISQTPATGNSSSNSSSSLSYVESPTMSEEPDKEYLGDGAGYFADNEPGYSSRKATSYGKETIVYPSELLASYTNVKSFGAVGDGVNDDANAIQAAISSCKAEGGVVYLPAGVYRMSKGVILPVGVNILGEMPGTAAKWQQVKKQTTPQTVDSAGTDFLNKSNFNGTWILVDHGAGNVNSAPTIRVEGNTSVSRLGFVYKDQAPVVASVVEYPPAIGFITTVNTSATRDGVAIEDIYLLNAYVGIAITQGVDLKSYYVGANEVCSTGRLRVNNITGGPLWKGIVVKGILDTVDVQNINFGYTNFEPSYAKFRHTNAVDIELAREDGIQISNFISFGASYGIRAITAYSGAASVRATNLDISAQIPMSFVTGMATVSNSTLTTINYNNYCQNTVFKGLEVATDSVNCVHQPMYLFDNIKVVNAVRSSTLSNITLSILLGKAGSINITNSSFEGASRKTGESMITMSSSGSGTSAMFYSCNFNDNGGTSRLATTLTSIDKGSLQFNKCVIEDNLNNNLPAQLWFTNSKTTSGSALEKH